MAPVPRLGSGGALGDIPIHGSLAARFRTRWSWDETDSDFTEHFSARIGDPDRHPVTAYLSLRFTEDVDGRADEGKPSAFSEITDTYGSSFNQRVYSLYADIRRLGPVDLVRAGRQHLHEVPAAVYLDGVSVESEVFRHLLGLQGGAYGGVPVHPFESSPSGDWVAGAWAKVSPWKGGTLRLDYLKGEDEYLLGTSKDELVSLQAWQSLPAGVRLGYSVSGLDREPRQQRFQASYSCTEWDLLLRLNALQQFEEEAQLIQELDEFFVVAREVRPYRQYSGILSKGIGKGGLVVLEAQLRRMEHPEDVGPFNREFLRVRLAPSWSDVVVEGLSLGLVGEHWQVADTDDGDSKSAGFDVTYAVGKLLKVSLGSEYSRFTYDSFTGDERQGVRSLYLRVNWKVRDDLRIEASFATEHSRYADDDALEDINTLKVGTSWTF